MSRNKFAAVLLGATMLTLVSCGDDDNNSTTPQQQQTVVDGTYRAVLVPVNGSVVANVSGTATLTIDGDNVKAEVNMANGSGGTHHQHIHTGSACPTATADTNADGVIDGVEAAATTGQILIPLDSEIAAQALGNNFPSGASYSYTESASYSLMLADLRLPDLNPNDSTTKLGSGDELLAEGKVVEIHGVPAGTSLPATAAGMDGMSAAESLPIACGVLVRIPDETPAPVN